MPKISKKGANMPSSPIRKLVPFANAAKKQGKKIYHLNIGQPDIKTPKAAFDAIRDADLEVLSYSPSEGFEWYRDKIAQYYGTVGVSIDSSDIIVTTGASEAINFVMNTCFDAGDEIIIPEPFYANYNGFSQAGGVVVKPITASIETGFALPPMEDFEKKITANTKAILICNPSNPTGYLYSREELEVLKNIVLKHDLYLLVDEVYREFVYDGKIHTSVLALDGLDKNAVVFDSVSKRYSACGARIGMIISRNKEMMAIAMKFAQARLSPPTLGQIMGAAMVDVPQSYIAESIAEYDERRKTCIRRLQKMEGVTVPNPGGAFYLFVKFPVDDTDKFCRWLLEDFDLNGETVMMAPGAGFYASDLGKQEARLAYVLNQDDLNKAMDCLEEALKVYPGRV
ncbi:MAG: aspartate aminotransferase [Maribacter sp.]|jgi:aspartate aminotransferase